jgi:hypothetical protein
MLAEVYRGFSEGFGTPQSRFALEGSAPSGDGVTESPEFDNRRAGPAVKPNALAAVSSVPILSPLTRAPSIPGNDVRGDFEVATLPWSVLLRT